MDHSMTARIRPLLQEPTEVTTFAHYQSDDIGRKTVEQLIKDKFSNAYDANIEHFFDDLFGLWTGDQLLGAVGIQQATQSLFSEQYLQADVVGLIEAQVGQPVQRNEIVELGNFAIGKSGHARLMIAALAAFLRTAGFRWVICTAISPLLMTMQRMGLNPLIIADADASKLGDNAKLWGRYYDLKPKVCVGSIDLGYQHLSQTITIKQPKIRALWQQATNAGAVFSQADRQQLQQMMGCF